MSWADFSRSRANWLEWDLVHSLTLESCSSFLIFMANSNFHPSSHFSTHFMPALYAAELAVSYDLSRLSNTTSLLFRAVLVFG